MQTRIAPILTAPLNAHVKADMLVMAMRNVMMSMNVKIGVYYHIESLGGNLGFFTFKTD